MTQKYTTPTTKKTKIIALLSLIIFTFGYSHPVKADYELLDKLSNLIQSVSKSKEYQELKEEVKNSSYKLLEATLNNGNNVPVEFDTLKWDKYLYPDYYSVVGKSNLDVTNFPDEFVYQNLDNSGRTLSAEGTVTIDKINKSKGFRETWEKNHYPSGWFQYKDKNTGKYVNEIDYIQNKKSVRKISNNRKVTLKRENGKDTRGYIYNASHLIADSLGGRAFRNNVITGTRTQNVGNHNQKGGMQYIENKVLNYIKNNPSVSVFYRATPVYKGFELIPRYVMVQALSSDYEIDETVIVFNSIEGYSIDYSDGTFSTEK